MKKRLISLALALMLVLSLSAAAFADTEIDQDSGSKQGETAVSLDVESAYIVTIPATVDLVAQGTDPETYGNTLTITASAGVRLNEGKQLTVTMESDHYDSGFYMVAEGADQYTLPYTVTVGGAEVTANGGTVATFVTNTSEQTSVLTFAANDPTYAGTYSDTVTFTIAVTDAS